MNSTTTELKMNSTEPTTTWEYTTDEETEELECEYCKESDVCVREISTTIGNGNFDFLCSYCENMITKWEDMKDKEIEMDKMMKKRYKKYRKELAEEDVLKVKLPFLMESEDDKMEVKERMKDFEEGKEDSEDTWEIVWNKIFDNLKDDSDY